MRFYGRTFRVFFVTPCFLTWTCALGANPENPGTASRTDVIVTVNPSSRHPISPYIYGINFATRIDGLPKALTFDRSGGNRWTAYNWETNASNAGSDYSYQNDNLLGNDSEPGAGVASLIAADRKLGMASLVTFQLQGLVAGDSKGPVAVTSPPDRTRFKDVVYEKKSVTAQPFTTTPSVTDNSVYMDEFIWSLDQKFAGLSIFGRRPSTQPVFAELDNEPELWKSTHLEIQGSTSVTSDAYITKTLALSAALKKQFPDLVIFGPANYGFMGIYSWNGEIKATASGNNWFVDKYLAELKSAATSFGRPLVDVYDFHWYPEATDGAGKRITDLTGPNLTADQVRAITQSPRSLWDETFKEKSWVTDVTGGPLYILGRLQARIDATSPGMKLAITEYNNGGGQHIAGTLAQADNLGVFGARGLFAANLWMLGPKEPYSLAGFRAFRNFDGANHHFGDIAVQATSSNVADVAVYVSIDSTRAGRVVMVAINRSEADRVTAVTGQPLSGAAHVFQMTAATATPQATIQPVATAVLPVSGSSITLTLPALSVSTVDIY